MSVAVGNMPALATANLATPREQAAVFMPALRILCLAMVLVTLSLGCSMIGRPVREVPDRAKPLRGCFGTYDGEPRLPNGRMDIDRLVNELIEIRVNTYNFLLAHAATDWDDLQLFLPRARGQGIRVWVTLLPPSESPPRTKHYSEPFRMDYERWGAEIARLSLKEPNLVAWSIDDFVHNLAVYTPDQMRRIIEQSRAINPKLAFVPCCYFKQTSPKFAADYAGLFDGVLFPYRHESGGANLTDPSLVESEVARLKELFGPNVPIIVDVYATRHSRLGDSTPEYVRQVMTAARRSADGVLIYCHQDKARSPQKYQIIKELFHGWR